MRQSALPDVPAAARSARERSHLYGLLAAVFWTEPGAALLRGLRAPELRPVFAAAGVDGAAMLAGPEEQLLEDLAVEFTRLFIGPGPHIAPYASVQMSWDGLTLMGPPAAWVRSFFARAGFALEGHHERLPDHIAIELDFMQQMAAREADALEAGDAAAAAEARTLQREFLAEHLGRWAPAWLERVEREARVELYRLFATLARDFLEQERHELGTG